MKDKKTRKRRQSGTGGYEGKDGRRVAERNERAGAGLLKKVKKKEGEYIPDVPG